jgi:hypothetical protein
MIVGFGLQQFGDQTGPAGLMRGADASPRIAVEVFVEWDVVPEMHVRLIFLIGSKHGPAALGVAQKDPRQPARQFLGDLQDRDEPA